MLSKRTMMIGFLAFTLLHASGSYVRAGDLMVGAKVWYTQWDSAVVRMADSAFKQWVAGYAEDHSATSYTADSEIDKGKGVLLGPVFSYTPDDSSWTLSLAGMFSIDYEQDLTEESTIVIPPNTFDLKMDSTAKLERWEIDAVISRAISNHFKVFIGYKFQRYYLDLDQDVKQYINGVPLSPFNRVFEFQNIVHMPTVGIGAVVPFSDKLSAGVNLGVGYMIPTLNFSTSETLNTTEDSGNINAENSWCHYGDINLSYMVFKGFILQLGYKYQVFTLKTSGSFEVSGQTVDFGEERDIFHGVTLAGIVIF